MLIHFNIKSITNHIQLRKIAIICYKFAIFFCFAKWKSFRVPPRHASPWSQEGHGLAWSTGRSAHPTSPPLSDDDSHRRPYPIRTLAGMVLAHSPHPTIAFVSGMDLGWDSTCSWPSSHHCFRIRYGNPGQA